MESQELLKATLARLELTVRAAAITLNVSQNTLASAVSGRRPVPPAIWVAILEYEERLYERERDIAVLV